MEKDIKCIILEDNLEYGILEEIENKETTYVYLYRLDDPKVFYIRKTDGEILYGLDSEEEYNYALSLIGNKHKDLLNNLNLN